MYFRRKREKRARTRILATGYAFFVMTILALLAAWNTGNQLLYIIFGGLLSFQIISHGWTRYFSVRGLGLKRSAPYAVHRGEPFWVRVRLENYRRLLPAFALRIVRAGRGDMTAGFVTCLPARRAVEVNVREVFERRGVYRIPEYDLVCSYPFGVSERSQDFHDAQEVLVYPRVHAVRAAAIEQFRVAGMAPQMATGDGDEFFNLREYVVGDDLRRIAWKVSARIGTWVIREMTRERSRYVVFVLDTRYRPPLENFEDRLEDAIDLAASLAVSLLHRHYNVALVTPGITLETGEGVAHEHRLLDAFARIEVLDQSHPFDIDLGVRALDIPWATVVQVSPDPAEWGSAYLGGRRVLDPREVVYA